MGQFNHLKMLMDNPSGDDRDEKMEQEIHNMQHIFNLYQVLIKKDNLIELRLILFLNRYNFCMLGLVLQNNTNLKILEIRNMINKDRDKDLDYTFKEMNEFGDNHDMSEEELTDFANEALKKNINVAYVRTQEELEKIYKEIYLEA